LSSIWIDIVSGSIERSGALMIQSRSEGRCRCAESFRSGRTARFARGSIIRANFVKADGIRWMV